MVSRFNKLMFCLQMVLENKVSSITKETRLFVDSFQGMQISLQPYDGIHEQGKVTQFIAKVSKVTKHYSDMHADYVRYAQSSSH